MTKILPCYYSGQLNKDSTLISRYVIWDKRQTPLEDLPDVLHVAFVSSNEEAPRSELFPPITRLAIRQRLAETDIGAEVVLSLTDGRPTLRLASQVTIADMELSVRSRNCLKAASIDTLDELLSWKPAQLMDLPNFGRRCLNEITDIVHRLGYRSLGDKVGAVGTQRKLPLAEDSAPLACLLQVRELLGEGSLSKWLVAHNWHTVTDLAGLSMESLLGLAEAPTKEKQQFKSVLRALSLELPLRLPAWFLQNTDTLRAAFSNELEQVKCSSSNEGNKTNSWHMPLQSRSLNEELLQLVPRSYDDRKRKIVSDLLGLGGEEPLTLDEVAKIQNPPVTRERVRQVAKPITDVLNERGRELPWLLKAIDTLKQLAPCSLRQANLSLIDNKILDAAMTVTAILRLARRSYLEHGLHLEGDALLNTDTAGLVDAVMRVTSKLSSRWGVADWEEIKSQVPEAATLATKALREVVWLDTDERYLVLPGRENSLANRLARILTVTPRLKLTEAYQGVFRDVRMDKERLPETLFAAFCGVWQWCSVEDDEVVARTGLPPSEASGDDLLVLLLREIGHPVRRRQLTERAVEQGLGSEMVSLALSYSNVIASANGYFAVIGDPRLEEFARGAGSAPAETIEPPIEPESDGIVPDESTSVFVGQLMLAVQERVAALGLTAPWSMSELRLSRGDRDRLLAWGRSAKWDFRADFGNYETKSSEKVHKRTALGLAFLLFASEALRRFGGNGSTWLPIEGALGEPQHKLFMFNPGMPKPAVREAVETACRTFGLRHGFEDVSQQVWVRTLGLQSGLQCSQLPRLGVMLANPAHQPVATQLLLDTEGPNASESFRASWKLLQDTRRGRISEKAAVELFAADSWLSPFPADELFAQCLNARHARMDASAETVIAQEEAYQYFAAPVLRWRGEEAYLEYSLNELAPSWRQSDALIFLCEDPFRRERVSIKDDQWQLLGGPVSVPLTQRTEAGFRFRLMEGKEAVFADWMPAGLSDKTPFAFFRASGVMVPSADDVPLGEQVVLLHGADVQVVGLDAPPVFRVVLRGGFRLTRLSAGAVARIQLVGPDGGTIWSFPVPEETAISEVEPLLRVHGGKWGTDVEVMVPNLSFTAERLRLNSGEVLPIRRNNNGRRVVEMSPGLARAQIAFLQGSVGEYRHSARVKLHHLRADFGAALETDGNWQPLDGSETLDAVTLRTQRMLAKVKGPLGADQDVCWMEGGRTLAGLRIYGTSLMGVHGLGESLNVVRGTYNSSQTEVAAARAVTDGGFWRSVQLDVDGSWSVHLPFEGPLEDGHALWMWAGDSPLPRELPREWIEKSCFTLRWRTAAGLPIFGWAFSFGGARVGSVVRPEALGEFAQHLKGVPWAEAAMWLRWWHVPVLHAEIRDVVTGRVQKHPVETLKAWLLPASESSGLMFDELREEAWAAAAREFLWGWRSDPKQAVELVKATGIWTGEIERDSLQPPTLEAVGLLARTSPILMADVITQGLPALYPYPKPQLAVLLGMVLETINPNAAETGFRLDEFCERYAKGESRLDGRFILTRLVGAAQALLRGQPQDTHNLRIAFHQAGLRELISTALLRDVFRRWQAGTED